MSYLRCLFTYNGVQHILCCVFVFCFVCLRLVSWLSVSLDCSFLIAPSVFSNVYSNRMFRIYWLAQ